MKRESLAVIGSLCLISTLVLGMMLLSFNQSVYAADPNNRSLENVMQLATDTPDPRDDPNWVPEYKSWDDRIQGNAGDRLVIYCNLKWREIDVWGVEADSSGLPLHLFDYDEVYLAGKLTVNTTQGTVSLQTDRQNNFVAIWTSQRGTFTKNFSCPFVGGSPTPKPRSTRVYRPPIVYTVTPAPSVTPVPTQRLY